jgi:DNA replication protein DnaC
VPLLIVDDLGMLKLPETAAEDLLELVMRRYERASTLLTSNRPVDDWGKLLGDPAAAKWSALTRREMAGLEMSADRGDLPLVIIDGCSGSAAFLRSGPLSGSSS